MADKLTRRAIDAWLRNGSGSQWLWCGELKGFGAERRGGGSASWVAQFRIGKGRLAQKRRVVIGRFPPMGPDEARVLAIDYIKAGWRGIDPVAEKRAAQACRVQGANTFDGLFGAFYGQREARLRQSSALLVHSRWKRLILPQFGSRSIASVRRSEVAALMDQVEASVGASAADKVFQEVRMFFDWYAARDDEFRSPLVKAMKRHVGGEGTRPMTDVELRAFWLACGRSGLAGAAGKFCLLTCSRRDETLRGQWTEVSGDVWTIPPERYKTARTHAVPLSFAAQGLLASLDVTNPYIFSRTGTAPHATTCWNLIVNAGGPSGPRLSWHSLRKSGRSLMAKVSVRPDIAERCLGHVQGAVERAYDKHEYLSEKRAAFDALAEAIERIVNPTSSNNLVRLDLVA
jgi:integrase